MTCDWRHLARLPPHGFFAPGRTRELIRLLTLRSQSFGYCPRAKRSRSSTRAGVVGHLFETAHKAIAPTWQSGAYIRSCELSSVVECAHRNIARKTKGWLEHEIGHAAETRPARSQFRRCMQSPECCQKRRQFRHYFEATSSAGGRSVGAWPTVLPPLAGFAKKKLRRNATHGPFSLCSVACVLLQQRCNAVAEHPFTAAQGSGK
jgi:hypothetical protein